MLGEWAEVDRSVDVERLRLCIDHGIGINKEPSKAPFEALEASIDVSILATARTSASMATCNSKTLIEFGGLAIAGSKLHLEGIDSLAPSVAVQGQVATSFHL